MTFADHARNEAQTLVEKLSAASRKEAEALATQARVDAEVRAEEALHAALAEANAQAHKELAAKLAEAGEKHAASLAEAAAQADMKHAAATAGEKAKADKVLAGALAAAKAAEEKKVADAQSEIAGLLSEREEQRTTLAETRLRIEAAQASSLTLLDGMRSGLHAIQRATTPNGILDTLLEHVGEHFEQTAVFHVGPSVQGWRARHSGVTFDLRGVHVPDAVTALIESVASGRESRSIAAAEGKPLVGLSNGPVADAFAVPLFVNGCVLAVIYAEDAKQEGAVVAKGVGARMAGILVEQATRRLSKRAVTRPPEYSAPRQARRVKLQSSVDIMLDGSASFLVDLSSLGAQVLSPLALRPNRLVEMELIGGSQVVQCKGRVIWALFEQPKGTSSTLYRAGVQFTEVDMGAVESFLAAQGISAVPFSVSPGPLQEVR